MIFCNCELILSLPSSISESIVLPITSLSAVWDAQLIAFLYSAISSAAFLASRTLQKRTASTSTGTVSFVRVFQQ